MSLLILVSFLVLLASAKLFIWMCDALTPKPKTWVDELATTKRLTRFERWELSQEFPNLFKSERD